MGRTFQRVHYALVGKFDDGIKEKIPQWIRANGGQFSRAVNSNVTHLIATEQAYKDNGSLVQVAKSSGNVKIVSYDWLEDSLQAPNRIPKKEGPYLLENLTKPAQPQAKPKKVDSDRITKVQKARQTFHAKDGVVYNVTMFRAPKPPSKTREKYQLAVFETIKKPHSYSTFAKFSRTGKSTVQILSKPKAKLDSAIAEFNKFFKEQTGKEWKDMGDDKVPSPKVGAGGESLPIHEGWFYAERPRSILAEYLRAAPNLE
ncbi:unnamed protein product [Penicillium olsonii]|nr:unnamed protein product [Penicillium olsonii]